MATSWVRIVPAARNLRLHLGNGGAVGRVMRKISFRWARASPPAILLVSPTVRLHRYQIDSFWRFPSSAAPQKCQNPLPARTPLARLAVSR